MLHHGFFFHGTAFPKFLFLIKYPAPHDTPEGVWCTDANGERHLVEGTTVICALGQRARTDVVEQLRNTAPFVRVIGDARRVSTITNAVYQGYHAALDI